MNPYDWPDPTLRFALASCQYPAGLLDTKMSRRSIDTLRSLPRELRPRFLIVAGDQIYVDATAGLFDPARIDFARSDAYETAAAFRAALLGLGIQTLTMLDDHEIVDNWEPGADSVESAESPQPSAQVERTESANQQLMRDACTAYVAASRRSGAGAIAHYVAGKTPLWFVHTDSASGNRFFFADTRTTRTFRTVRTLRDACIVNEQQWSQLRQWLLAEPVNALSFVVSPALLLPRRLATACDPLAALHSDAWDGYPASLHALLATLCEYGRGRTVFLSGDEHLSCATTFRVSRLDAPARTVVAYSIHGSALYAPFPFANGSADALAKEECFEFDYAPVGAAPTRYRCEVETWFPSPENGFACIATFRDECGGHGLKVDFYTAAGTAETWHAELPSTVASPDDAA